MNLFKKPRLWAILYALILGGFTAFVVLDTFVIPRAYVIVDETKSDQSQGSSAAGSVSGASSASNTSTDSETSDTDLADNSSVTDNSYSDENINITITEYREYDTSIYVADIVLSSADYLQTAFANSTFGKNITQTTSEIAGENNAVLAINGDFYGAQNKGYVIRNGTAYRSTSSDSTQEDLVIYSDGSFGIISEGSTTTSELLKDGAAQVLSFGPALIDDGEITVSQNAEVDKAKTSNPRTAIGIIDDLHYIMVVSDGRTDASAGLTIYELASFMEGLGATTAYNLDGGGSSTMYFNGNVINNPTTNGKSIKEREVSDIVYIGY